MLQPEFIALGSIINDFLNPDFTLIGELDEKCGAQLEELYSRVMTNGAASARMSLENAELTKISVNTFVTTKITFANMLAEICEKLPNGEVRGKERVGLDTRIGRNVHGALGSADLVSADKVAGLYSKEMGIDANLPKRTIDNRGGRQKVDAAP